jgi:hypothetical protein
VKLIVLLWLVAKERLGSRSDPCRWCELFFFNCC